MSAPGDPKPAPASHGAGGWNMSAWAIESPIPAVMLFFFLCLAGLYAFRQLDVAENPDISLPVVSVTVALPGASPPQLETEVTRKVEDSIASIGDVKHISSTVTDGVSSTAVEFAIEKDVAEAVDDVRDAVTRIRSELPTDAEEPIVTRVDVVGGALLTYSVSAPNMDERELSWFVDNQVAKAVLGVKGVAQVNRVGGVDREIRVELDPLRLNAMGVSAAEVSRALQSLQREVPGGRGDLGNAEQSVRTLGTASSVAELGEMRIALQDGRSVRLDALAKLSDTGAERRQLALLDGQPVVGMQVFRSRGAGELRVGNAVRARLEKLATEYPGVKLTEVANTINQVEASYNASMTALWEGALLAVLVVWWFLRDGRATWVSALALPLSVIPTFAAMYWLGFTLNGVTLLALALVVGILVDDAIVEVENIDRHLRMGKTPKQAALEAAQEIGLAVIATTLTLVAVFLPTAFMGGIPGKFFKQFGWTAAIAVLVSLLVARLLTPMMAAYMLRPTTHVRVESRFELWYLRFVRRAIERRRLTVLAALAFFIGSLMLTGLLPTSFIPAADKSRTQLTVELPPGSNLEETRRAAEAVRVLVAKIPEVTSVYTAVGAANAGNFGNGATPAEVRRATLTVNLVREKERDRSQQEIEEEIRQALPQLPGARYSLGSGEPGEKLQLVLAGDDPELLNATAGTIERELRKLPELGNVTSSASLLRPEIQIRPLPDRAALLGVDTTAIGQVARVATAGDFDVALAKFNLPERQLPIRVLLPEDARTSLDTLRALRVPAAGGPVMLGAVADVQLGSGPAQVARFDRSRNVILEGELGGAPLGPVLAKVNALPEVKALPAGVRRVESGDAEIMMELFAGFGLAMLAGVLCVYAILVLLFDDFLQPVTILVALPLSIGGAFGLLLLTNTPLSLPALIGLLMLMGIATKNSILLVEYAIVARRDLGMSRIEALVDACHKRARPIVMTSIAMGAGMLPIALGLGEDSSFRSPMAIAVIGGLVTSTVLSLVVVPAVYTYVDDIEQKLKGLRRKAPVAQEAPAPL